MTLSRPAAVAIAAVLVGGSVHGQEPARAEAGATVVTNAVAMPTPPTSFVAIQPCRLADTRGNGFTGAFGPPALAPLSPRVIPVAGYCGVPATAWAVSANLSVTQPVAGGWVSIWPEGFAQPSPLVAAITYAQGQTISNAFVAPLGTNGGITLYSKVETHVVIDVNGYYRGINPSVLASNCRLVGTIHWCFNPDACGQPCNDVCASLGFSMMPSDADWFAAQDSLAECQAISQAFGLGTTVNFDAWPMACVEDTAGTHAAPGGLLAPLFCSGNTTCPTRHRTNMDWSGFACGASSMRSICPCL